MRISLDEMMMDIARVTAQRSTCPEAQVGAVLATKDGRILSVGYNGVPRGFPHCTETGCQKDNHGHHLYVVHAEQNSIINAAREGVSTKGAVLYCTRFPCSHCAANIIQAGIVKVVYDLTPADFAGIEALNLFRQNRMELKLCQKQSVPAY